MAEGLAGYLGYRCGHTQRAIMASWWLDGWVQGLDGEEQEVVKEEKVEPGWLDRDMGGWVVCRWSSTIICMDSWGAALSS